MFYYVATASVLPTALCALAAAFAWWMKTMWRVGGPSAADALPVSLGRMVGEQRTAEPQQPQHEWHDQWSRFSSDTGFLFDEWIAPITRRALDGLDVLEPGCGGGHHTELLARHAASVTAVDLNTSDLARERNRDHDNVVFVEADCASMDLGRSFDAVVAIGMVHHTDDPDRTFANLYRHLRQGGLMILWVYSREGNLLVRLLVEPFRRLVLRHLPRAWVSALAHLLTILLYPVVHTIYRIRPFSRLPFFEYFESFRRLSFRRNVLNVFDKLNAPQTHFIDRRRCERWMGEERFEPGSVSIRFHQGVSWSLSGIKKRS